MEAPASSNIIPVIFFIVLLLVHLSLKKLKSSKPSNTFKLPPGPWKLPLIGNIHLLLGDHPHRRLRDLANKYGPLHLLKLGEINHIVVTSPDLVSKIIKTHDINFASRPELLATKIIYYDSSDIGFSPYGKYWSQLRKICTVEVLSTKRVQSYSSIRKEEGDKLLDNIRRARGSPVNLKEMLLSLTSATISRVAFGKDCAHQKKFLIASREAFRHLSGFDIVDFFPSLGFIGNLTGSRARLERVHQHLDEILNEILEEHQAKNSKGDETGEDIVDVLLRLKNHGQLEIPLTLDNIKAVILDLFIGGSDTTSSTLEWAMALLVKHPNIMQKVQSEVRNSFQGTTNIEESDLSKLPYLNQVVKETLRLYPPAPLLAPRLCRETIELDGKIIPVGSRMVINAWAIMREPRYWVNSESFQPERFEDTSHDFKASRSEYIPFGVGRRMCPGIAFATAGISYWLAQLLFHFDWELPEGIKADELDMKEDFGLTVSKKNGLLLVPTLYK